MALCREEHNGCNFHSSSAAGEKKDLWMAFVDLEKAFEFPRRWSGGSGVFRGAMGHYAMASLWQKKSVFAKRKNLENMVWPPFVYVSTSGQRKFGSPLLNPKYATVWWALRRLGVTEWIMSVIWPMYEDATTVKVNWRESKAFSVRVGVHQGSVLRPLRFIIVEMEEGHGNNSIICELRVKDGFIKGVVTVVASHQDQKNNVDFQCSRCLDGVSVLLFRQWC